MLPFHFKSKWIKFLLFGSLGIFQMGMVREYQDTLLITGFEDNGIANSMNTFESNPSDKSQRIQITLANEDAYKKDNGKALKLDYNVDSFERSRVEFWVNLEGKNLSKFDTLILCLRGDKEKGFDKNLLLQFVDTQGRRSPYITTGIEADWKEFHIHLKRFARIVDWSHVKEFGIIFDNMNTQPKKGTIYMDEIRVGKERK